MKSEIISGLLSRVLGVSGDVNRTKLDSPEYGILDLIKDLPGYLFESCGNGNFKLFPHGSSIGAVSFEESSFDNLVICCTRAPSRRPIVVSGRGNCVVISPTKKFSARISVAGSDNLIYTGPSTTCNDANIVLDGVGKSVLMGRDCMLSFDISVRATDSHAIIDLDDLSVINSPESICLGSHVWVGEGASLLKGASVGSGSVIGSKSLVSGNIAEKSIAIGVPARVVRTGVSWTRTPNPTRRNIEDLREFLDV